MVSVGVAVPEHVATRLAAPKAEACRADVSFWEFMTLEEYDIPRPKDDGLSVSTATNYDRRIRQIGREVHGRENFLFENPPDYHAILRWRDSAQKGGKARLEPHRKALLWIAAWWGHGGANMPEFLGRKWATQRALAAAKAAGTYTTYNLFLQLPVDVQTLLGGYPYETQLRGTKMWGDMRRRKKARYLDATWKTMVFLGFYSGCRPNELATLRLDNYQPARGGILDWKQPKKGGETRMVAIPEAFVWHSKVDPSLDHYREHVRPDVEPSADEGAFFLTGEGKPFTELYAQKFFADGMRRVLGERSTGGHGLRRACATWRYHHGWELREVAELLHDTENVVRNSYLDWAWLRSPHGRPKRSSQDRPAVPRVRSNGKRHARRKEAEGA